MLTICLIVTISVSACSNDKSSGVQPSSEVTEESASPTTSENNASPQTQPTPQTDKPETASTQSQTTTGQADEPEPATVAQTNEPPKQVTDDSNQAGLELAKKSGCLACHALDKKVVGPPWNDVAKRYAKDPNAKSKLIIKVSKGGRGNWTELVGNVAMPPYSPRVSDDNIAKLVEFVLSLKD
jgi:cytochrome c